MMIDSEGIRPCGQSTVDFESISLAAWTHCQMLQVRSNNKLCVCIYTYMYTHTYMYICREREIHTYLHIYIYIYIYTYVYICIYAYVHTYIYIYIHSIHKHARKIMSHRQLSLSNGVTLYRTMPNFRGRWQVRIMLYCTRV